MLGEDEAKKKLQRDLDKVWQARKTYFDSNPDITGQQLYRYTCDQAREYGWDFGGLHAGHLVGTFPHERIPNDKVTFQISDQNENQMRSVDGNGHQRHWILETHLVDRERKIGGFREQLLTVN